MGLFEVLGGRELEVVEGQSNGEVKAVISGLVGDDEHVLLQGEVVKVDLVFGGGDQIAQLAQLGLPGDFVKQLDEVDVGGVRAEVLLQNDIDSRLKHEGIVVGDHAHTVLAVPAGLTTTGDGAVHHVITDQEESLEQFSEPAQSAEMFELFIVEGLLQESQTGVRDGETTVQLSTGDVDIDGLAEKLNCQQAIVSLGGVFALFAHLFKPLNSVLGQVVLLRVGEKVLDQGGKHGLERFARGDGRHSDLTGGLLISVLPDCTPRLNGTNNCCFCSI